MLYNGKMMFLVINMGVEWGREIFGENTKLF